MAAETHPIQGQVGDGDHGDLGDLGDLGDHGDLGDLGDDGGLVDGQQDCLGKTHPIQLHKCNQV